MRSRLDARRRVNSGTVHIRRAALHPARDTQLKRLRCPRIRAGVAHVPALARRIRAKHRRVLGVTDSVPHVARCFRRVDRSTSRCGSPGLGTAFRAFDPRHRDPRPDVHSPPVWRETPGNTDGLQSPWRPQPHRAPVARFARASVLEQSDVAHRAHVRTRGELRVRLEG